MSSSTHVEIGFFNPDPENIRQKEAYELARLGLSSIRVGIVSPENAQNIMGIARTVGDETFPVDILENGIPIGQANISPTIMESASLPDRGNIPVMFSPMDEAQSIGITIPDISQLHRDIKAGKRPNATIGATKEAIGIAQSAIDGHENAAIGVTTPDAIKNMDEHKNFIKVALQKGASIIDISNTVRDQRAMFDLSRTAIGWTLSENSDAIVTLQPNGDTNLTHEFVRAAAAYAGESNRDVAIHIGGTPAELGRYVATLSCANFSGAPVHWHFNADIATHTMDNRPEYFS